MAKGRAGRGGPGRKTELDTMIGQRIRASRLSSRLSQTDLGKAIGVTFQQIQKYENGSNAVAPSRMAGIANKLGVSVPFLMGIEARGEETNGALAMVRSPVTVRMLSGFNKLPNTMRTRVADFVETLAGKY